MLGAINNVLSNGNHTNDNNTTIPSSFLSVVAVTVAVALPWVRCIQYLIGTTNNPSQYCYQYCTVCGATNYVLSGGNNMNDRVLR